MEKIKVVVIDEQAFFRVGVHQVLSEQPEFEIVGCDLTQEPLGLIDANLPDVVLLGSDLATLSRLELCRKISRHYPNTKVIVLSPAPSDEELFEVIRSAAAACLSKNAGGEELASTIRQAREGKYPINDSLIARPTVARHVLKQFEEVASMEKAMETVVTPLTHRETQILHYITEGNSNKQIAYILQISEQTIKNHVSAVLRKLNANDRAHAVALAIHNGWIVTERKNKGLVAVS